MKQVNAYSLYDLAKRLSDLKFTLAGTISKDSLTDLIIADLWIERFIADKEFAIELSEDAAKSLREAIARVRDVLTNDKTVESWQVNVISKELERFETVLSAELQKHLTFNISQVGGYSMQLLVHKAEVNLDEDIVDPIPENAKKDVREAGRSLAFDLPTAAGIHIMRATESVLRKYYRLVTKKDADIQHLDWGTVVHELKEANAEQKIVSLLDQIRSLHRNPLMHPEDFLTPKEALRLFDIAKSAINALAEEVKKRSAPKPRTTILGSAPD